jgi:NDP-sugar pyrophosphorylase family protein
VRYSWEAEIRDTGGGIKQAEPLLAGEPFVVANGDSLLELPLRSLTEFHAAHGGIASMVVRSAPDAAAWGLIELDPDDRVRRVAGRPATPDTTEPLRGFMFPGLHVLEPAVFRWMDAGQTFGVIRETYPRLLGADQAVYGLVTRARWVTIDTPTSLAAANDILTRAPFSF